MIGTIEQAIIDAITAATSGALPALGYTLKKVASYGGELEGEPEAKAGRFPAALVVFIGINSTEELGGDAWRYHARFGVIVGNQDRRNNKAARHGAGNKVGSYQLATDVLKLLVGSNLGLGIGRFTPGRIVALENSKTLSIYSVELNTTFDLEFALDESGLADFATFHADWDVPPHGNVPTELPASTADASDTVTLETS